MSEPYYRDEWVTLWHGDSRELLPAMGDMSVDAVITDPPYTERTHSKATNPRKNRRGPDTIEAAVGDAFAAITDEDLRAMLQDCGRVSRGWVVATLDYRHAVEFDVNPPTGLKCQRVGVCAEVQQPRRHHPRPVGGIGHYPAGGGERRPPRGRD
jgi:site-specific DNA-methyltransferase (adenine-specific)